ncbi:metallopeptidase TldD-related protein [Caulobacter sp.]|uniref:metallopeptidase TldD-related protein n=1 Tax=Caulobacter sp. TaxID=78 RepID=UPI0031D576DC
MTTISASAASHRLGLAQAALLEPHGVDLALVAATLDGLSTRETDFADLYFETTATEEWQLENGVVTRGGFSIQQGVGARSVAGDKTGFAYSSAMTPKGLLAVTDAVKGMRRQGQDAAERGGGAVFVEGAAAGSAYPAVDSASSLDAAQKVELLQSLDRRARAIDPRITQVTAFLRVLDSTVLVAATDGTLAADVRPLVRLYVSVLADNGQRRAPGGAGTGGRFALADLSPSAVDHMLQRATRTALLGLEARPAPSGEMTVVLASGFPGIMLHEAVGHGLEGDTHRQRMSVFGGMMGETVAAPGVTVLDDATIAGAVGSLNVDDEGVVGQRTPLIENGKLVGLMQDRMNARLLNDRMTGNGRRQSYAHLPMPRMTNTFLAAGAHEPKEIIASVKSGIYAVEFGGGTVDITSGQFNFSATQAWLIEDGQITAPLSGATLIGQGHQSLKHVSMVGSDLKLDEGEATCGKHGQTVDVCVGQPTVRIDNMIVGGAG